jgi:hypothetical protein
MSLKTEIIALSFGLFIILLNFGDSHLTPSTARIVVGNLDTIFGSSPWIWRPLDVLYVLVSILLFLLYGKMKGGLKLNPVTVLLFISYLFALALISIDDISDVLNLHLIMPIAYWIAVEWFYPVYSIIAFFVFGKANECD